MFCCCCCCLSFCYVGIVCGFRTEYLDLIDYHCTLRCCATYEYVFVYTCHVLLLLLCSVLQYWYCLLLLFVIVCRMTTLVAVVHFIGFQCSSLHSNTIFFQCTPWQYCRIYSVDFLPMIHTRYRISSVFTGMRGATAGVTPPRRSPPCNTCMFPNPTYFG